MTIRRRMRQFVVVVSLALSTAAIGTAHAAEDIRIAKSDCTWRGTSVWVETEGRAECIRYFHAGLKTHNPIMHVFLHGDVDPDEYRLAESKLKARINTEVRSLNYPLIFISRPGARGSSGNHVRDRRTKQEAALVSETMDAIKQAYDIETFHLHGQSSGARMVSLMVAMRDDIGCAVMGSGGLSQRLLMQLRNAKFRDDFLDPLDLIAKIKPDTKRRMIILHDSLDQNTPFVTSATYFDKLTAAGHKALFVDARGKGKGLKRHDLAYLSLPTVARCAAGMPDDEIRKRVLE
jgi:hypothetical protein